MNNLGYSNDNLHIGDVRIKGQNETLRIGDDNGGNGYVLPTEKGNDGDVLTMNADNTTSFQPINLPSATARVVQNLFQMEVPRYYYTNLDLPPSDYLTVYGTSTGSEIINRDDIAVGGVVRFRTKGYVYNDIGNAGANPTGFGQFRLFIGIDNILGSFLCDSSPSLPVINSAGMGTDPSYGRGWWSIEVNIIKLDDLNNCYVSIAGLYNGVNTGGTVSDTFDLQFYNYGSPTVRWPNSSGSQFSPSNFYFPLPPTFKLSLSWRANQGNAYAIATEYTIDYLNPSTDVLTTTGGGGTSDHLLLSNLNGGALLDGGHTNLFLINGLKPMTGNINLNNNNMINTAIVSGPNGDLDFTLTETHLNSINDLHLESASNFNTEVRIQGTGEFKVLHGGGDRFVVGNNLITASRNIDMNSNNISEVNQISSTTNNNIINFDIGPTNELQLSSQHTRIGDFGLSGNSLYIDSNVAQLLGTSSIDLSASKINITGQLDMNGNEIINANKFTMNNTLAEHPIIVYLPALASDFSGTPYNNVLVTINASGNIRPIAYGDPDGTGVVGVTDEIITTDGLKRVQIGGICSFTPASGQVINAGTKFERANTGTPINFGTVMVATGVGTCGIALTSGTGDATGSVKILGLWTKNEHF